MVHWNSVDFHSISQALSRDISIASVWIRLTNHMFMHTFDPIRINICTLNLTYSIHKLQTTIGWKYKSAFATNVAQQECESLSIVSYFRTPNHQSYAIVRESAGTAITDQSLFGDAKFRS